MEPRNKTYLIAFGENLKQLIDAKKKTPEGVAAIGGIETKQVYRAINGEHSTGLAILISIAKGLDVHPKKLFEFEFDLDSLD